MAGSVAGLSESGGRATDTGDDDEGKEEMETECADETVGSGTTAGTGVEAEDETDTAAAMGVVAETSAETTGDAFGLDTTRAVFRPCRGVPGGLLYRDLVALGGV